LHETSDGGAKHRTSGLDPAEERIHRFGDPAIVSVKMRVAGRYMGTAFDGVYRYLRVWIGSSGRWQIVAGQVTAAEA
jgi:ketosteroid isomerase-like protein